MKSDYVNTVILVLQQQQVIRVITNAMWQGETNERMYGYQLFSSVRATLNSPAGDLCGLSTRS